MAEVTIVVKDIPGGKVAYTTIPSPDELLAKHKSGHGLSAAEGYAICALNKIKEISEVNRPKPSNIWVP